jgi:hypothetical protein
MQIPSDNQLALDLDSYSMLKRTMSVSMAARKKKKNFRFVSLEAILNPKAS